MTGGGGIPQAHQTALEGELSQLKAGRDRAAVTAAEEASANDYQMDWGT